MLSLGRSALQVWHCVISARASMSLRCQTQARRLLSNLATRTNDGVQYRGQTLPYLWLRDTCQCPRCVHPSTRQKLHRSTDVDPEIRPKDFEATKEGVKINWESGHESFYPLEFLERYSSASKRHKFHKDVGRVPWDQDTLTRSPSLFVSYDSLQRPNGLLKAMTQIVQYGLLFVRGVPNQETSNETCELRTLATKFGELRETFYGPLWDVINARNSTNIAYTNLFLDLHMDLLYFQHPPRYQILHCLRNRVNGGSSVFVDALRVAESLRHPTKDLFKSLSTAPVHFHYINNGHHYHQSHPTIELDHDANVEPYEDKPIKFINYSPPFQAPLSPETDVYFYHALKEFVARLEAPGAKFEYQLREGDAVVFDNRRVLHARTAFTDKEQHEKDAKGKETDANEPNRWLKGCYLEEDALLSLRRGLIERSSLLFSVEE